MNLIGKIKKTLNAKRHKPTYAQDGLTTLHNNGFMKDPAFMKAEKAGAATGSWSNIHWRVHTVLWAARQCAAIEGDFVECGTNKGGFARAIIEYIDLAKLQKEFYLLDTFEGLVDDLRSEEEKKIWEREHHGEVYTNCYAEVKQTFSPYPFVKIIKGAVPGTLPMVKSEKLAFLSIDMNCVEPEIAAMDFFWDKLSKGAIVLLDDYAYVTCDLQYAAHNQWAKAKGIQILSLPTGQGLIIK